MKKAYIIFAAISLLACPITYAQITNLSNTSTFLPEFVGWTGGFSKPLDIRNNFTQPINFFTANTQRIVIRGQAGMNQGFVGIGNGFTNPVSLLHVNGNTGTTTGDVLRTTGPTTKLNTWRLETGTSEKFRV